MGDWRPRAVVHRTPFAPSFLAPFGPFSGSEGLDRDHRPRPGRGSKTGRRPLLGPPARIARALSQKMRVPSMHATDHPRGAEPRARKSPAGLGGGIRAAGPRTQTLTRPRGEQTRRRAGPPRRVRGPDRGHPTPWADGGASPKRAKPGAAEDRGFADMAKAPVREKIRGRSNEGGGVVPAPGL